MRVRCPLLLPILDRTRGFMHAPATLDVHELVEALHSVHVPIAVVQVRELAGRLEPALLGHNQDLLLRLAASDGDHQIVELRVHLGNVNVIPTYTSDRLRIDDFRLSFCPCQRSQEMHCSWHCNNPFKSWAHTFNDSPCLLTNLSRFAFLAATRDALGTFGPEMPCSVVMV